MAVEAVAEAVAEAVVVHELSDQLMVSGISTRPWYGYRPEGHKVEGGKEEEDDDDDDEEEAVEAACAQMRAVLLAMTGALVDGCGSSLADVCFVVSSVDRLIDPS